MLRNEREHISAPFRVQTDDGEPIDIGRLLRVLPGKRITGEACWHEEPVLGKLFVARNSARHWKREWRGLAALQAAKLPTPAILGAGRLEGGGHFLLTKFLPGSRTLAESESAVESLQPDDSRAMERIRSAFTLLGRLHAAGLIQTDPHFGNFLKYRGELFFIDGDGVQPVADASDTAVRQTFDTLALMAAQLPPGWDACLEELIAAYTAEQDRLRPDRDALFDAIARARGRRLARFLEKTVRDCSQFAVERTSRRFTAVVRAEKAGLAGLLADPDAALEKGRRLKDGNTSTVVCVETGGSLRVIKRYNIKSVRHAVSRFWRPSRAWHSWVAGHRLAFFGISTPAPLALIEERIGPFRRRAYLVNAYCPGTDLLHLLDAEKEPEKALAKAIVDLFSMLSRLRISHGDLKATNLLWSGDRLFVIDLDAMKQHRSVPGYRRAWRRDRKRFLQNWPEGSTLWRWLDRALPPAR